MLDSSSHGPAKQIANAIAQVVESLSRKLCELTSPTRVPGCRGGRRVRVQADVLGHFNGLFHMHRVADDQHPLQSIPVSYLFGIDNVLIGCMRALLDEDVASRNTVVNCVIPRSSGLCQFVSISLAAGEYDLSYFAAPIKVKRVVDSLSKDRRYLVTPYCSTQHHGCIDVCVGRRTAIRINPQGCKA